MDWKIEMYVEVMHAPIIYINVECYTLKYLFMKTRPDQVNDIELKIK
jgi:hypothetical protein